VGAKDSITGVKRLEGEADHYQLNLVPNSRICGNIPPFPSLFKHRDNFSNFTTHFETHRRKSVTNKSPNSLNSDKTKIKQRNIISEYRNIFISILEMDLVKEHRIINEEK
jgi:hypothetical protein